MTALVMFAVFCFCAVALEADGNQSPQTNLLYNPYLQSLYPMGFDRDDLDPYIVSLDSSNDPQTLASGAIGSHPPPWVNHFYQSIPKDLKADNVTADGAPPVFAIHGDSMGALGFQMCDIEHYLDHENHTLPPCPPRAGWATKVAEAYKDRLWLVNQMIRSTSNARRVTVSQAFVGWVQSTLQVHGMFFC
jgi:hypothetical protein